MQLAGEHNALNATAAAALAVGRASARMQSLPPSPVSKVSSGGWKFAMSSTASPSSTTSHIIPRRFAKRLRALRSVYPDARLWAVLEPRSNTLRRKVLENDLVESLRLADRVILAGVYQQQRIPDAERLHPEDVVNALNAAGTPAELHPGRHRNRREHRAANCKPAMSSPSSPMAASTASMRNFLRGSEPASTERESLS